IFRTVFHCLPETTIPLQFVTENSMLMFSERNLSSLTSQEQEIAINTLFQDRSWQIFDLENGPLLYAVLNKLSSGEHILFISLSALYGDLATLHNFAKEILHFYGAYLHGRELDDESMQYADISAWLNELLESEDTEIGRDYWQKQDILSILNGKIPLENNSSAKVQFEPQSLTLEINSDTVTKLEMLASKYDNSISVFLLACWQIQLWRFTEQSDIVVGTVSDGRKYQELEDVLGLLTKYLPIHSHLEENLCFRELLEKVKETLSYAHKWQEYFSWESIAAKNENETEPPFFPFCFDFQEQPANCLVGYILFSLYKQYTCIDRFKVKLSGVRRDDRLLLEFHYDSNLFPLKNIKILSEQYLTLLESAIAQPDNAIADLNMCSDRERQRLLIELNDTQTDYPLEKFIHQLFEEQVELTPEAFAVVFENQQLTYRELNNRANQLAHYLKTLGVEAETLVGIYVERSLEMVVGILAVLKAGGAYVPLDPSYPSKRLIYMLQDAQVSVLLTQQKLLKHITSCDVNVNIICLDTDWEKIAIDENDNPNYWVKSESLAYVIYTSGSTGLPKGVAIEHRQLYNYLNSIQTVLDFPLDANYAIVSTIAADLGNTVIFASLCNGGCLHIISNERITNAKELANYFKSNSIDCLKIVPSHLRALLTSKASSQILPRQRLVLGGESTSWELIEQVQQLAPECQIINHYGPTEATVGVLTYKVEKVPVTRQSSTVPIGRPLANTQIYILDSKKQPVPIGVPGEIYLGGDGLARGYLNHPELTVEKFILNPFSEDNQDRFYKTGDKARYLSDGNIEYLGRIDNQVKIRGFRIELGEIEAVLNQYPQVQQVVVMSREDIPGDKRLVAYLVSQEPPSTKQILQHLSQTLPKYMLPGAFVFLETLPLTPNGKIDRRALPAPDLTSQLEHIYVAPTNPIEELLVNIWCDVLNLERLGIYDNFFELGGHSLLATILVSRIRKVFQVELPLRSLFEAATVAELSQEIKKQQREGIKSTIPPLQVVERDGKIPLSFAQQRLWFLDQLEPESGAYNTSTGVRIKGQLNQEVLVQSFSEIIRRHEVLRTNFVKQDGEAVQIIHPPSDWQMSITDLQALPISEREAEIKRLVIAEATKLVDLATDQLVRGTLLLVSEREHVLLLTMHHIISDGWSMGVLIQEITTLYSAFIEGKPSPLSELAIQYADFAVWQREWLTGEELQNQLSYWQKQLAGAAPRLELPTDRPRPAVQTFQGANQSFRIPLELTKGLTTLSQLEGTTLFMTLLAAFQTLLYRYTGQTDISVGSPIANRNHEEIEGLIGFFVNTLVLRTQLENHPSFRELLQQVREVSLGAYAHQDLPFEMLVEQLQPERNLSHTPLFQVMFVLQNAPTSELEFGELTLSELPVDNNTAKFDLTLSLHETEDG
ncbi:MAG: hypothetical protein RLZZ381_3139, partial [Cyanobacteriota bacterium]